MLRTLLREQSQLGIASWGLLAHKAGVSDSAAVARCIVGTVTPPIVDSGVTVARRIGVTGTPGVIVNGYRFAIPPSPTTLKEIADGVSRGDDMRTILLRLGMVEREP